MKKVSNKLTVTWGLPGSGKTTFCENATAQSNRGGHTTLISHDDRYFKNNNKAFISRINDYLMYSIEHLMIDTLITSNEGFANLFRQLDIAKIQEIEIQYWVPDVEACLWNDRYRRDVSSEITIRNTVVEEPDVVEIKELCPKLDKIKITVVKNRVVTKEPWKMFADKYKISHRNGIVRSETWSLGGTAGNCWNDNMYTVSPGTPLTTFKEFDDILLEVCPNLGFLQYKKVYNECVVSETQSEGDYYGGSTTEAWFQYSVPTLYNELMNMGVITAEE